MNVNISKFVSNIEIAWSLTWTFLLITYYIILFSEYNYQNIILPIWLNIVLWKFILQIIFILSSFLSISIVWINRNKIISGANVFLSEGSRIVFSLLNISFYIFILFDLNQIKIYFEYLWLILPWLLWIPIVIDLSNSFKQELSWIK
jgi:hypothetical protein